MVHLDGLKRILGKFERAGLKLKPQKLQILVQKLVFLGHQINQGTISPNPDKLEIIKQLKPPNNQKTCRSVCGLLSYFRRYVQNYATIAKPLTDLLKKSGNFECPPAAVEALSRLKQELLKAPVLELPNLSHDFCLQTDASSVGIGAVLFNINPNGKESIVQYASRALTEAERKYSTVERECLAVVVYMEHFRQFLLAKKFTLRVDQKSLIWLHTMQNSSTRLTRWVLRLQAFDYTEIYIKGRSNILPDFLSRNPKEISEQSLTIAEIQEESAIFSIRNIALHQDKDDFCSSMKRFIAEDEDKNVLGRYYRSLQAYGQNNTRLIPVIPKSMEGEVIYFSHVVNGCHMGEAKTMGRIKGNFHFPKMYKKVKEFIQSCEDCAKHKSPQTMPRAELGTYGVPAGVGDLISIDIWGSGGGLPVSAKGNRCVLTIVDHFNSFLYAYPVPDEKASTIAKTLVTRLFLEHGIFPKTIPTDNGPCFRAKQLDEVTSYLTIKRWYTSAYMGMCNGKVERKHRELAYMLGIHAKQEPNHWDDHLPFVEIRNKYRLFCYFRRHAVFHTALAGSQDLYGVYR
ncbi:hypothetical protein QYM36_007050 [Artemia franciscana]|uniref:RNA-directed DNA polymerase n=1 Tax=Artemia franciscana TaxID=6661 RepID=A0AA88HTA7_ARTSF|nr:hypothetical protein QYM36_007050 [Artemia franciscana]